MQQLSWAEFLGTRPRAPRVAHSLRSSVATLHESAQFCAWDGCVCNVSPDRMTHRGRVNFDLQLFFNSN